MAEPEPNKPHRSAGNSQGQPGLGPTAKGILHKYGGGHAGAPKGGSHSFLVGASDGEEYWCKAVNNPQGPLVPVVEQAVGRFGRLIGVPVCDVRLIRLPPSLAGEEFAPNTFLEEGWAHGSLAVAKAVETRELEHRGEANNASRHAGFFALYDWLLGTDDQWLISGDHTYFSHDHGGYLLGGGWAGLEAQRDQPHPLARPTDGLHADEIERLATALEQLTSEEIAAAVGTSAEWPEAWPFSEDDRRRLIEFAHARASGTAERIRSTLR